MNRNIVMCTLLGIAGLFEPISRASAQEVPARSIVNIAPDLYRVQNNNHYTVFLVTPEGIILSDPISRDFSTWLKGEIKQRFNRPVRYVLYTHHDWDHASGGAVWADTAQFVGHVNMHEELSVPAGNIPLPQNVMNLDANKNGRIERSEARQNLLNTFALTDANNDGALTGAELERGPVNDVHAPNITYTDRHTVTLGGKTVHMIYLGQAHAVDSSALHFPAERVVFSADVMQVRRIPNALTPNIGEWINAYKTIEKLDFDFAATGHAMPGKKQDVVEMRQYLEDLSNGVVAGIAAGRSLQEIQRTLTLDKYKAFERWDTNREMHIAQVYAMIKGTM